MFTQKRKRERKANDIMAHTNSEFALAYSPSSIADGIQSLHFDIHRPYTRLELHTRPDRKDNKHTQKYPT